MKRLLYLFLFSLLFVQGISAQINAGPDHTICQGETVTMFAVATGGYGTDSYSFEVYPYQPETYTGGTPVTFGGNQDDQIAGPFSIGFQFCFFNQNYTNFYIGSNGWVGFSTNSSWTTYTSAPIPSTNSSVPKNCIMAPWQDWHPGVASSFGPPYVFYKTIGTAPNRKLIVYWYESPMFSCTSTRGTFQIVLNEQSSVVENHLTNKPNCPSWAGGTATQGVHNSNGTVAFTATGRNSTQWTVTNESTRFVPSGIKWYVNGYPNGTIVGYGPELIVTPSVTTVYTAVVNLCGGQAYTDDVIVTVIPQDNASFSYGSSTLCQSGFSGNPTASFPGGLYTSTPPGLSINPSTGNINLGISAPGTYTVTHYTTGACPDTASIVLTVGTSPSALFGYPLPGYCVSAPNPTPVFPPGSSAGTFTSSPNGLVFVSIFTGEINLEASAPGTYTVTNTIPPSAACPQVFYSTQVVIYTLPPNAGQISGNSSLCENPPNTVYTTSQLQFTSSYQWTLHPASAGVINGSTTSAMVNWVDNFIGIAHIQVRGVNDCGIGQPSPPFAVNVNPLPKETGVPIGPVQLCQGAGLTQYYSSGSAFATHYQWEIIPPTAGLVNGQGQQVTVSWSASFSGTAGIRVRGVNECGTSVWSSPLSVEILPLPLQPSQPFGPESFCQGGSSTSYTTLPIAGANGYNWTISPSSAGVLSPALNTVNISWNAGFSGNVQLAVSASSDCGNGPTSTPLTIAIAPLPAVNAGNDTTVMFGVQIFLMGTVSGIANPAIVNWQPEALLLNAGVLQPQTLPLEYTSLFTLYAMDAVTECQASDEVLVEVQGSPLVLNASASEYAFCQGNGTTLTAQAFGGEGTYQYTWYNDGVVFSYLQSPYVIPGESTHYVVAVFDGISVMQASVDIVVYPLPLADAGPDLYTQLSVPVQLSGNCNHGGNITWSWHPADSLVNAFVQNPFTKPLYTTNFFTLTVTDENGCVSLPAQMIVNTQGGILGASPLADPDTICMGSAATLYALPFGGLTSTYTCQWFENGLLLSSQQQFEVSPSASTSYQLVVGDGFSTIQRDVQVTVNPLPVLNIIASGFQIIDNTIMACVFDTVVVKPGTQNVDYLWSNGSLADSTVQIASGISFDYREMWVKVTDIYTGCISRQDFNIAFTFSNCSYGIPEQSAATEVIVYPNPTSEWFVVKPLINETIICKVELTDLQGRTLMSAEDATGNLSSYVFNVKQFKPGLYLLRINVGNHLLIRKLLIVNN